MGYFLDSLKDLGGALRSGLDPDVGLSFLDGLKSEQQQRVAHRQENRMARAEQQNAMGMSALLSQAAQSGMDISPVLQQARQAQLLGMQPNPGFLGSILSGSQQQAQGDWFDTSPQLDVADRRAIMERVAQERQRGRSVNDIRADIHEEYRTDFEYDYDSSLSETVDLIIQKALSGG